MIEHLDTILTGLTLIAIVIGFSDRIFNRGGKETNLTDRVCNLEKSVTKTSEDISKIKDNHLTHMQADINKININLAEINTTLKIKFEEE